LTESFENIVFDAVSFDYDQNRILNEISFKINKNDRVLISGESGSGKSTLLNLILGIVEPKDGSVFYNGKELNQIRKNQFFKYSFVFQENIFFEGTLIENIDVNSEIADHSEIKSLMIKLGLGKFINKLYTFNIGDNGSLLSIGEKQRFALIRAVLQKPEILFLDEFTSALDYESENIVYNFLNHLELTIIFISHRPVPNNFYVKSIQL